MLNFVTFFLIWMKQMSLHILASSFLISKFTLYMDDILLASNSFGLLQENKGFLTQNFEMKDMGEAPFVIGIEIHRDRKY